MATKTFPTLTALEAQGAVNLLLSDHLPDRFMGTHPRFDAPACVWRVSVVLAYPVLGPLGEVGEVVVSAASEEIISHTSFDEMLSKARQLYERHREAIEAPLP